MTKKQLKIFKNPPILETERLILRRIKKFDIEDIFEYANNPSVSQYLLWRPHPDLKYTESYYKTVNKMYKSAKFYDYAIIYKADNKMIGTCGFTSFDLQNNSGEIGYVLNQKYWGKGLANEAVSRIIEFAKDKLQLDSLYAEFIEGNSSSKNLLLSLRFENAKEREHSIIIKGKPQKIHVYTRML